MRVVAPGKLVLVGEYAVLDGAPAVVAAVDRGVVCTVSAADHLAIECPGDDSYVSAALHSVHAAPALYRFEDHNPVDLQSKAGLGGSAAATVAAVLAGRAMAGSVPSPLALCVQATAIHRQVQGSGSGIDVAASAHGGVLRFEADQVQALPEVSPVVIWSGRSAQTGPRVARYLSWRSREAFVHESRAIVDAFESDPVGALREANRLLSRMTALVDIDWATPEHRLITTLAGRYGGAAKPSGAGGGDVAVALFADPEAAVAFAAACEGSGLPVIPVNIAPGACVIPEDQ
jgi:phosphomevalonate kinase